MKFAFSVQDFDSNKCAVTVQVVNPLELGDAYIVRDLGHESK